MKYLKVPAIVASLLISYVLGMHYGYVVGVAEMGAVAGPALLQCVNILGGKGYQDGR